MTRLRLERPTSCVAIGYSNYLAIDQKEKLIKNEKNIRTPRPPALRRIV